MGELETIVQRMIDAGESEENISKVIQSYNSKKATDPMEETAIVGSENKAVNTDSTLDPGLSELSEANEVYVFDENTKVSRPDIINSLRNLDNKLTGSISSEIYDFKDGKAYKVKDNVSDQFLLDSYLNKFKRKPLKTYKGQELDEVVVKYDSQLEKAKKIQSKLDFLKPTDQDYNIINEEADNIFLPENELPKRLVRADKFDKGYYKTIYPDGYKEYLEKADNDLEKAKKLYIEDKTNTAHADKVEEWARENESLLADTSVESFLKEQEKASKIIGDRKAKELTAKNATAIQLNNEIEANNSRLLELTELTFDNEDDRLQAKSEFDNLRKVNENIAKEAKKLYDESILLAEESNDNALLLDVVKRSYSVPKIAASNVGATVSDIVAGALNIPEWLYVSIGSTVSDTGPLALKAQYRASQIATPGAGTALIADAAQDFSKDLRNNIAKPIEVTDINSLGDFGYWATDLVSNQLPNVALMVAAPEVALPILSASATGNKYSSMMEGMSKYGEKYKGWQLMTAPLIVGAAEYVTEKVSLGQLKNVKNIFKKSPEALKAANEYIENNILKGQYWKTTFGEAGAEGVATLSENITDIYVLNDETKHVWDGVPNAVASGGFMSGVIFKAPAIGAKLLRPFAGSDLQDRLQQNFKQFQKISKELNENKNLSESAKNSLVEAQVKITNNSNDLLQQSFDKIDGLSEKDKIRLIEIDKKAAKIEVKAKEIFNDNSLSEDIKKSLIDELNSEYKDIKSEKNIITKIGIRETMLEEAVKSGVVDDVSFKSFDTAAGLEEYVTNSGRSAKDAASSSFNYGTIFQKEDGTQEILINKELAKSHKRISTADHEFLHAVLYNTVKNNPQAAVNLGKALFNELQSLDSRNLFENTDFGKRLKNEISDFKDGLKSESNAWEEALTLFSEALVNKEFDESIFETTTEGKTFIQKIKEFIQRLFNKEIGTVIEFNSGKDVINFIREYNESFQTGKWGENIKKLAKEGAKGKLVKGGKVVEIKPMSKASAVSDIQAQLNTLEDELLDNVIDYDTYEAKSAILEKRLEQAKAQSEVTTQKPKTKDTEVKSKKDETLKEVTLKSKKILDDIGNDPKGFNKNNPKIYEVLEGIIRSKSKAFRTASNNVVDLTNLPGFEMENMVSETITNLVPMINRFDPAENDSLYGYLNSQLANKMRLSLKQGKVTDQNFTEDVTEVKGITADEPTTQQVDKPKYTKLTEANVFDSKVIDDISEKMVSTVRVLKNKLTAAIGRNQNTTPLIKEILANISTQADIDIKKAMGGKENGKLRKFLLKNKKAIIENATTTFLMGKDSGNKVLGGLPIAIQKQVDGKFLPYPEWIGKKIDRETTASRGATSGNQIVRRVPANKISDTDYLDFFLEPTGNPIRGRKEALAKELAGEIGLELFQKSIVSESGPIFEAFEKNQELLGEVLENNYIGEINKQVERGTVKFSKKATVLAMDKLLNSKELDGNEEIYIKGAIENVNKLEDDSDIKKVLTAMLPDVTLDGMTLRAKREMKTKIITNLIKNNVYKFEDIPEEILKVVQRFQYQQKEVTAELAFKQFENEVKKSSDDNKAELISEFARLFSRPIRGSKILSITTNEDFLNRLKSTFGKDLVNNIFELKNTNSGKTLIFKKSGVRVSPFTFTDQIKKDFKNALKDKENIDINFQAISDKTREDAFIAKQDIVYFIEKQIEKGTPKDIIKQYLYLLNGDQNSIIRKISWVEGYETGIKPNSEIVVEHVLEAKKIMEALMSFVDKQDLNKLNIVFDNSKLRIISKDTDTKLRNTKKQGEERYTEAGVKTTYAENKKSLADTSIYNNKTLGNINEQVKFSKAVKLEDLEKRVAKMIERKKGIPAKLKISPAAAANIGKNKGKFAFYLPPNAEDFNGLMYKLYGKGKQGDADMAFIKEYILDPYNRGEQAISSYKQNLAEDYKAMEAKLGELGNKISKEAKESLDKLNYNADQAVRIALWSRAGYDIPGISESDIKEVKKVVLKDERLRNYTKGVKDIVKGEMFKPSDTWYSSNIRYDLFKHATEGSRAMFLEEWQQNSDAIFTKDNLAKMEAAYGSDYAENLKQTIQRMKTGKNRAENLSSTANKALDYINGSVGVIMWMNTRSAILQMISAVNYINWHDNNPLKIAQALGNPKNFAKNFMEIWNSDFLKQRRSGLEINVEESEIAKAVEQSKNKAQHIFNLLIKKGFKPTQMADSFAIAIGGTPLLINRTKTYIKQGFTEAEAKQKAFEDLREISEENQQSSRMDKVSNIQTGILGRIVFAFNNTPFQMTRLQKKAALDLANGRGDWKTNISKLVYYSALQSIIFYALQQGTLLALFGKDDEELTEDQKKSIEKLKNKKYAQTANAVIDGFFSGSGLPGKILVAGKNALKSYYDESAKGYTADYGNTLGQALSVSPPLSSKYQKTYSAFKAFRYGSTKKGAKELEQYNKLSPLHPYNIARAKIFSAATNVPIDRLLKKTENLYTAYDREDVDPSVRIALGLGWGKWELGFYDDIYPDPNEKKDSKTSGKTRSEIMKEVWKKRKAEDKKIRDSIKNVRSKMTAKEILEDKRRNRQKK